MIQTNNHERPEFLDSADFQLLLFGGKGGVGKTTCAVAGALQLARLFPQRGLLLVSTDPAHSLMDSLGDCASPANLAILELDAAQCLERFKACHAEQLRQIASRGTFLDDEDISRFLELSLPGLDELMSFLEISAWVQEGRYDCVIVDTAPTGHTLRMLQTPQLVRRWLAALDSLLAKHRYMRRMFAHASEADELDRFLLQLEESLEVMENLLRDETRCRFTPVMLAEPLSVQETVDMLEELQQLQLPIADLVVNRLYPASHCVLCNAIRHSQLEELSRLRRHPLLGRLRMWGIPHFAAEVRGREALQMFWEGATDLRGVVQFSRLPAPTSPCVEAAVKIPSRASVLVLFGGKGGVGKTTIACTTALAMAAAYPSHRVLLFSADPAHSLADCLGIPVGPVPAAVLPRLDAVEIDAEAEFRVLREQYAKDLADFLSAINSRLDFTFDREVMEKILDLAPPGLDEVMALCKVLQYLDLHQYDVVLMDAAATGHLLRWLELPRLVEQWLKVLFGVLLKYREVIRLPAFSQRLVAISRNLKKLAQILRDPAHSQLIAVSILTEMALAETEDLVAVCQKIGLHVPVIVLNLATPDSACHLCAAVRTQEQAVLRKFQTAFPEKCLPIISRGTEVRGLPALRVLAQAMYGSANREAAYAG